MPLSHSLPSPLLSPSSGTRPSMHLSACVCEPAPSYLTVEQQVQLPVDPLLNIQPPLQVLAVVFNCQLAKFAVRRLLCFVCCLEHHPGLGAGL